MSQLSYILFDDKNSCNLLPLTATRAVADLKVGILTIGEKWKKFLNHGIQIQTQEYLQPKYALHQNNNSVYINASFLPSQKLIEQIATLNKEDVLMYNDTVVAFLSEGLNPTLEIPKETTQKQIDFEVCQINYPWDIFMYNGNEIKKDIILLDLKPNAEKLSKTNQLLGAENIYVGNNVSCECAVLNAQNGPIYLADNSEIMEGCTIRGSFYLGEYATLKMQSKIYGDTSIGKYCKVGGEVSNTVMFGYSNKGHDGFLGNSVLGEWCNLGADTNCSNLKNNYGIINMWNYPAQKYISTDLQFCGLIMGDHAKSAINTQFNTGTVVGVCANIFDAGFPPKFVKDFSWGNNAIFELDKAFEVASKVMERRGVELSDMDKNILTHIFDTK